MNGRHSLFTARKERQLQKQPAFFSFAVREHQAWSAKHLSPRTRCVCARDKAEHCCAVSEWPTPLRTRSSANRRQRDTGKNMSLVWCLSRNCRCEPSRTVGRQLRGSTLVFRFWHLLPCQA